MRHAKDTCKLGRTSSHRRCLFANQLKSLIVNGRIRTTLAKAKELRRYADRMVTLAKTNTLDSRRRAITAMMVRFNALDSKDWRLYRQGAEHLANDDRKVIKVLFEELGPRFANRAGGYTRIIRSSKNRIGDNASMCYVEYLTEEKE